MTDAERVAELRDAIDFADITVTDNPTGKTLTSTETAELLYTQLRGMRLIATGQPSVPEPPAGIANVLLECGDVAQMKEAYLRLHLLSHLWCQACNCSRAITLAPEQEMKT